MKTWHWLGIAVLLGLVLRCAPVWGSIFTHGYVNYASPDSYYQLITTHPNIYQYVIQHVGLFRVFVPLVLFIATALMFYLIGKEIFSSKAGIVAAFAFSLLPGEYLTRSILGEIDYHAFEVFLTTGIILCLVLYVRRMESIIGGLCSAAIFPLIYLYAKVWAGSILFAPIVMAFFVFPIVNKWLGAVLTSIPLLLLLVSIALHPGLSLQTWRTTAETQPFYTGLFPTLHVLLAAGLLFMKQGGKFRWPLFTWTLLLILATILMRRFEYYLIVPLVILLGGFVSEVSLKRFARPAVIGFLFVTSVTGYILYPKPDVPPVSWHSALDWVKDTTPQDSLIVSWWDYGYWIDYLGQRKAYIDPGQDNNKVKAVAKWLLEGQVPDGLGQDVYLIIDKRMLGDFLPAIRVWAGENGDFVARLYISQVSGYEFEYRDSDILILKYKGESNETKR
jgi:asparagine N-glycosylation enzyme membrane subunit Stt3